MKTPAGNFLYFRCKYMLQINSNHSNSEFMYLKLLLISVVVLLIAFIGMAFNILFRKNGKFPQFSIGHNKEMKKRGIHCAKCEEYKKCTK